MATASRSALGPIAAQPTARGRTMRVGPIVPEGVLVGYGDYDTNTGPIDVLAVSTTGSMTTLLAAFDTEQIGLANPTGPDLCGYRELNDAVWVPSVDPRGGNPGSLVTNHGGTWHTVAVAVAGLPVAEHIFDVAQEPNGDLYVCGSHVPDTAFVWRSTNLGATWTEVLAFASGQADGYNRFYDFRRKGGALAVTKSAGGNGYYVRQVDGTWTYTAGSTTFDTPPGATISSMGETVTVSFPGLGVVATVTGSSTPWSASLDPDGSVWLCDGSTIWRQPPT